MPANTVASSEHDRISRLCQPGRNPVGNAVWRLRRRWLLQTRPRLSLPDYRFLRFTSTGRFYWLLLLGMLLKTMLSAEERACHSHARPKKTAVMAAPKTMTKRRSTGPGTRRASTAPK